MERRESRDSGVEDEYRIHNHTMEMEKQQVENNVFTFRHSSFNGC